MAKIEVKRTNKNYGLALSGKLGSQPALEEEYVRRFISTDPGDGITSLREAILSAYKDKEATPAEWGRIHEIQGQLAAVKEKLLRAGYTMADLMKLTLDNSQTPEEEKEAREAAKEEAAKKAAAAKKGTAPAPPRPGGKKP